ncbi:hypothetical protein NQZ68_026620, partial [Dissostichus eleginoides]
CMFYIPGAMEGILLSTAHSPEHTFGDPFLSGNAITLIINPLSAVAHCALAYLTTSAGTRPRCKMLECGPQLQWVGKTDLRCSYFQIPRQILKEKCSSFKPSDARKPQAIS